MTWWVLAAIAASGIAAPWTAAATRPAIQATPQDHASMPSVASPALDAELARIAAAAKGPVGVAVVNLTSGLAVEWNGEERFKMASTFKVPLAVYAMHQAEAGKLSLTRPFPVARSEMLEPGILHEYFRHEGVSVSTLNAIELSITRSDNGATDIIYNRAGGPVAANEWLRAKGFADINLGSLTVKDTFAGSAAMPSANSPGPSTERTATPRAMARFLADLHGGRLIGPDHVKTLLDIMSRTLGDRIALHLPAGVTVLHKTGTLFSSTGLSVNDVGYIRMANGETLAIAIFIKDSPEAVSHATRDNVIGHIARAVYDYFLLTGASK